MASSLSVSFRFMFRLEACAILGDRLLFSGSGDIGSPEHRCFRSVFIVKL